MRFREIEKIILKDGWYLKLSDGSYHQYINPAKSGKVTIPKHNGDLLNNLIKLILKQVGLK